MIEEILTNLYKIDIPLPKNPLRSLNSYLIKGSERNLIIDTGMDEKECLNAMKIGLRKLEVDLKETDFFITHFHLDHLGLVSKLTTEESILYFNQPDAEGIDIIKTSLFGDGMIHFTRMNGFPEDELQNIFSYHPAYPFQLDKLLPFKIMEDGDMISIGDYQFQCVKTPGHTKGHVCLYESNKKILISGDHILNDITLTIQLRSNEWNPLKEYLASLDKVYPLEIELVLPGHKDIFRNCKERIQELKHHHRKRGDEIFCAIENGSENAYQVASRISWDISYDSWDLFPVIQKWFAIGEVIAHLKYLEEEGMIRKEKKSGKIVYSLNASS